MSPLRHRFYLKSSLSLVARPPSTEVSDSLSQQCISLLPCSCDVCRLFFSGRCSPGHQGMPKHAQLARIATKNEILTAIVWVKNVNTKLRGSL